MAAIGQKRTWLQVRNFVERWEIIERVVLVAVGISLIALCFWLVIDDRQALFIVLIAPVIFWCFWQAFFEDLLTSTRPPTTAERVAYHVYVWSRRVALGGVSLTFAAAAIAEIMSRANMMLVVMLASLAAFSGWVAVVGAGKHKSMSDDLARHRERQRRYK